MTRVGRDLTEPSAAMCACGHLVVVHNRVGTKGFRRGPCTHMDATGQCPCPGPR